MFAVILLDDTELPHLHTLLLAITVTIALSVYAHGLTARPLTERYARWWNSHPRDARPAMESVPAEEHRLRVASRAGHLAGRSTGEATAAADGLAAACDATRRATRDSACSEHCPPFV